jgi:hypothetical protein
MDILSKRNMSATRVQIQALILKNKSAALPVSFSRKIVDGAQGGGIIGWVSTTYFFCKLVNPALPKHFW